MANRNVAKLTVAALCLGLLLLMSVSVTIQAQPLQAVKGGWSLSSLYDSVVSVVTGQKEEELKTMEEEIDTSEQPSKYESAENEGVESTKENDHDHKDTDQPQDLTGPEESTALLLEKRKAEALEQQRLGMDCIDCIDDGEGNMLPSSLVHAIKMQQKKHQVDEHEADDKSPSNTAVETSKNFGASDGKTSNRDNRTSFLQLQDDGGDGNGAVSRNLGRDGHFSKYHRGTHHREFAPRWKRQHARQVGKKRASDCRCEYPGENLYRGNYRNVAYKTVGGMQVLPSNHPSCVDVKFDICPGENANGSLWKCPLRPNKPMFKPNKTRQLLVRKNENIR
jgi:hypothetical protein